MKMQIDKTSLPGVLVIVPKRIGDARGFFSESWNRKTLHAAGLDLPEFVQDNHSMSAAPGTLRGLHYQSPPMAQGKLVRCGRGRLFDVAVDIRKNSPTFGQWVGVTLSGDNKHQLWIPPGLAHGFLVISDSAEFLYKTTDYYAPAHERCIAWNDPTLAIDWKLDGRQPLLSAKDAQGLPLAQAELFA